MQDGKFRGLNDEVIKSRQEHSEHLIRLGYYASGIRGRVLIIQWVLVGLLGIKIVELTAEWLPISLLW